MTNTTIPPALIANPSQVAVRIIDMEWLRRTSTETFGVVTYTAELRAYSAALFDLGLFDSIYGTETSLVKKAREVVDNHDPRSGNEPSLAMYEDMETWLKKLDSELIATNEWGQPQQVQVENEPSQDKDERLKFVEEFQKAMEGGLD